VSRTTRTTEITDNEVEGVIREFFDRNYDLLSQEGGHVLAEGSKRQALEQSLLYWRKLKAIATSVTETEVKLSLPGQKTQKGRPFVIEGVVDIVREGDKVRMYDLKTHEESEVRTKRDRYEDQLNVYSHIWKGIRRQSLDGTGIIATRLPVKLREALRSGDSSAIESAMKSWQPVVDLPFDPNRVSRTIKDFARCVDAIEDGEFAPPPPESLAKQSGKRRRKVKGAVSGKSTEEESTFGQINCSNCDARFSCDSYRQYSKLQTGRTNKWWSTPKRDLESEIELDAWIEDNLGEY
jgi:hypothetical protein